MAIISHTYCCVAIPLYNVGIYLLLAEQLAVAFVIGVLCIAAPTIIAVDIPSFGPYLLAIVCFLVAIIQLWGAWGVYKEKPKTFRIFSRINGGMIALAFALALAWIILSIVKHNNRTAACVSQFSSANSSLSGQDICSIFLWIQSGVMGLLWLLCFLAQLYFVKVASIYGFEQRIDHKKYNSIYSAAGEELARQSMMWDSRVSTDESGSPIRPFLGHLRTDSAASKSSLRNEVEAEAGSLAAINKERNRRSNLSPAESHPASSATHLSHDASAYHNAMYGQSPNQDTFQQQTLQAASPVSHPSPVKNFNDPNALYGAAASHMQSQFPSAPIGLNDGQSPYSRPTVDRNLTQQSEQFYTPTGGLYPESQQHTSPVYNHQSPVYPPQQPRYSLHDGGGFDPHNYMSEQTPQQTTPTRQDPQQAAMDAYYQQSSNQSESYTRH